MRALLFVLLPILLFAQQPQPPSPAPRKSTQNNQRKTTRKQNVASDNQATVDSVSTAIDKLTSEVAAWKQQEAAKHDKDNAPSEGWAVGSTIVSVLATVAIAILAFFQWRTLEGQRQAMAQQSGHMRRGLAATRKAADAAKSSADIALNGGRGWILVDDIVAPQDVLRVTVYGESGYMIPLYFSCRLRVFGPTPCKVLDAGIRFHLVDMRPLQVPSEPDLSEVPEYRTNIYGTRIREGRGGIPDSGTVVAPERTIQVGAELESGVLTPQDIGAIREYRRFICAYGLVAYRDAFGRSCDTRFCYVYRVNNNRFRTVDADNVDLSRFVVGGPDAYNKET